MDTTQYFQSLSMEIRGLRDRVRCFIKDAHWPTDGEWKETVLRSFLRRNLPHPLEVGRGFVIGKNRASKQIDLLIYDSSKPVLFRDGDLVFITPDAARGVIEVKSSLDNSSYKKCIAQIKANIELLKFEIGANMCFFGVFAYESTVSTEVALEVLRESAGGSVKLITRMICLGDSHLIQYWHHPPSHAGFIANRWHSYRVTDLAFGYFLHNCLEFAAPGSTGDNEELWFPAAGKELNKDGDIDLK